MAKVPIYEQVTGGKPGRTFVPSGLYALVGHVESGRFVRATTPSALRTMAQWQDLPEPAQFRCPNCLRVLPPETEGVRGAAPCPFCDSTPQPAGTASIPATAQRTMCYVPEDMGARMVALRRDPTRAAERTIPEVRAIPLPREAPRETYAQRGGPTMDQALETQRQRGQRPPAAQPLVVMVQEPCERCGAMQGCPCPPRVPRTLDGAVARRKQEYEAHMISQKAAYPMLRTR